MKKNIILRQNKFYVALWIFFHALVFLGFLACVCLGRGLNIESNLFSMMPSAAGAKDIQAADSLLTSQSGSAFFIFAGNTDFSAAKAAALEAFKRLSGHDEFSALEVASPSFSADELASFVHARRFNLLPKSTALQIASTPDGAAQLGEEALAKIYGAFSLSSLSNLESDPFMLDDAILRGYLGVASSLGSKLSPKEGVLAAQDDGVWYVAIRGRMGKSGSALGGGRNGAALVYEQCLPLETDGTRFVFSGTPFHSYKSALSASREISAIGILSMAAVVLILFLVFKSALPIALSVFAVIVSCAAAFCATRLLLGKIHLTALVFGTSLIGCCIDYSLHFFIRWKSDASVKSGGEIRKKIFTGLALSLASTEICYLLLFFAPFELLRQVAVFSFSGILSSFLTSVCLFPVLPLPANRRNPAAAKLHVGRKIRYAALLLIFAFFASALFVRRKDVRIQNDISSLYKMEGRLKDDSILSARLLGQTSPAWFVVSGESEEAVLEAEELLQNRDGSGFSGGICTSLFAPSKKRQDESRAACEILLSDVPSQLLRIGLADDTQHANDAIQKEFYDSIGSYVLPEDLPKTVLSLTENMWLGKIGERYYSVFMPQKILDADECRLTANAIPGVFFVNKVEDISLGLDELSLFIAKTFLVAFALIAVLLAFFYGFKALAKIVLVPLASVASIAATFVLSGTRIEFFCMTGTVLVFGLGLDYIIYMTEHAKRKSDGLEMRAVLLSFATTAISFGALAFSSFVPVHIIGLSVLAGLSAAFVCTFLES